ncbi:transcriptional regulator with XRE-family HTH domain [Mycobacterium frederiksbergense]|uniref:Transcriptional regulator with XRE-family HTH domain n=1 Tax=Mycolicibacterium frederiksbergense TaxID=117567 RepID=A0ABT6L1A1_9MYCO|nr:helix-turn-helix transcriptional regulator [Mycolicibacterium frederiksbergense]MDH6196714.1 transcriptional regulator with XRE-family HTH domain [Mycolicibacterium frederiksbergense]
MPNHAARAELGGFLRMRRESLDRSERGLPPIRGRHNGLRREEVAFLSSISVTWYTWLEQGRDINPSRQVLEAIGQTLALTPADQAYLLSLAGFSPGGVQSPPDAGDPPEHLRRLLEAFGRSPAFAIDPDWEITAWNHAYAALYPRVRTVAPADRNLLWLVFTDPSIRQLMPDWEVESRRFVSEYRMQNGARLGAPTVIRLLDRLRSESPEFERMWEDHAIEGFQTRIRRFDHQLIGTTELEYHRLVPADLPDLNIVVYTPATETAADQLNRLVADEP